MLYYAEEILDWDDDRPSGYQTLKQRLIFIFSSISTHLLLISFSFDIYKWLLFLIALHFNNSQRFLFVKEVMTIGIVIFSGLILGFMTYIVYYFLANEDVGDIN